MHDDFQPYYVSTGKEEMITTDYKKDPESWMVPMKHAEKSDVVEIPANWTLDDWPPFQWDGARPNAVSPPVFDLPFPHLNGVARMTLMIM